MLDVIDSWVYVTETESLKLNQVSKNHLSWNTGMKNCNNE